MKSLPTYLTLEEFKELMKHTKKIEHKIAFLFGFGAGLRLSEIAGGYRKDNSIIEALTKDRIYFNESKMLIRGAKGSKDRFVPIPKGFKESMLQYLPLNKKYKNIKSARRGLELAFKRNCKKAKLLEAKPNLHFHSLRHGFCSRLANQGVPLHQIKVLAGHSNISTTDVYLQVNPKEALDNYDKLF